MNKRDFSKEGMRKECETDIARLVIYIGLLKAGIIKKANELPRAEKLLVELQEEMNKYK